MTTCRRAPWGDAGPSERIDSTDRPLPTRGVTSGVGSTRQQPAEVLGDPLVATLDGVCVDPQRHRRIGVAEPPRDAADVVTAGNSGHRSGEVPEVMEPPAPVEAGQLPSAYSPPTDPLGVPRTIIVAEDIGLPHVREPNLLEQLESRVVESDRSNVAGLGGIVAKLGNSRLGTCTTAQDGDRRVDDELAAA